MIKIAKNTLLGFIGIGSLIGLGASKICADKKSKKLSKDMNTSKDQVFKQHDQFVSNLHEWQDKKHKGLDDFEKELNKIEKDLIEIEVIEE